MSDFSRLIEKAISEMQVAKVQGSQYAEAALIQARIHINLALDEARRQTNQKEVVAQ